MEKIYRAGVIPYYIDENEIMMLFMKPADKKYGGNKFQVAKGKREEGETDIETAFREAGEELGLFSGNIIQKHDLGTFLGRTRVYLAEINEPDMFGDPHFETGDVKWMSPDEFNKTGRDLHKPIIKAAARLIIEKHDID